jgi:exonuclease 3'-5' domain-containing protein 1
MSGFDPVNYQLCATADEVASALDDTGSHAHVLLDCEGKSLGEVGGAISLLSLGTLEPGPRQRIYVLDVIKIRSIPEARDAVAAFLARADIVKVVWDGRMDWIELREAFGVEPVGVVDLQIAEVLARPRVMQESEQEQRQRVYSLFQDSIKLQLALIYDCHVILGMQAAMNKYVPDIPTRKDRECVACPQ